MLKISEYIQAGRDPLPELSGDNCMFVQSLVSKYSDWTKDKGRLPVIAYSTFGRLGQKDKNWPVSAIIVDEISQVNALKLLKLFWTESRVKMVFVGDPKQLAPHTHQRQMDHFTLPITDPHPGEALQFDNGVTRIMDRRTEATLPLTTQHRMPPEIFGPIALSMYSHLQIADGKNVKSDVVVRTFLGLLTA